MAIQAVSIPTKRLATSILSTDSSFQLNNILSWDGTNNLTSADFPTRGFGAFRNSTNTQIEFFEFDPTTIASSSITIVARGLGYDGGLTGNTETKYNWNANETYVELGSDTPQIFQLLRDYIDAALIAGAANATTTLQGLVELATQAQVDAGTATGETGAKLVATPDLIRGKLINDYAVDSVGTDAYAITITPAITAYAAGQRFTFKAGTANTGACTLAVSGLAAIDIKKNYNEALVTGDILANQIVELVYDGTNMQMVSKAPIVAPTVQTFTYASTTLGDATSQFDITNPAGSTFRYTWDGTGTDPGITSVTVPTGIWIVIDSYSGGFSEANLGSFLVTGSGSNYFEVTNASGVAEINKVLTNGFLKTITAQTYTKPSNLKYAIVEVQGAGGGGGANTTAGQVAGGGASGGYSKKLYAASALSSTESVYVGPAGAGGTVNIPGKYGAVSVFKSQISYGGGGGNKGGSTGLGGAATGGDINVNGQGASSSNDQTSPSPIAGKGADSMLGLGGVNGTVAQTGATGTGYGSGGQGGASTGGDVAGGDGAPGIVIVTEYYS